MHDVQMQRISNLFRGWADTVYSFPVSLPSLRTSSNCLTANSDPRFFNRTFCSRWTCNRQMSLEGGFQGRTNKLVDGCYSFWQGGVFPLLHNILTNEGRFSSNCGFLPILLLTSPQSYERLTSLYLQTCE